MVQAAATMSDKIPEQSRLDSKKCKCRISDPETVHYCTVQ